MSQDSIDISTRDSFTHIPKAAAMIEFGFSAFLYALRHPRQTIRSINARSSREPSTVLEESELEEFSPFSRLPPECRFRIWKFAATPRIVHIFDRGTKPVGLHQACAESSRETGYIHLIIRNRQSFPVNYRISVNYRIDILLICNRTLSLSVLEYMMRDRPTKFRKWNRAIIYEGQSLIFYPLFYPRNTRTKPWEILWHGFPGLKELYIMRTHPRIGYEVEHMEELPQDSGSNRWQRWLEGIREAQKEGYFKDLKLKYVVDKRESQS